MKPKNFPTRKLQRIARAKQRKGLALDQTELQALETPRDIRFRVGRSGHLP